MGKIISLHITGHDKLLFLLLLIIPMDSDIFVPIIKILSYYEK